MKKAIKGSGFDADAGGFSFIHIGDKTYTADQVRTSIEGMDELRSAIADLIGADRLTWPDHGNAPLAIAATVALLTNATKIEGCPVAILDLVETAKGASFWGEVRGIYKKRDGSFGVVVEAIQPGFDGSVHVYPVAQVKEYKQ